MISAALSVKFSSSVRLTHPTIPHYIDSFTVDTTQEGKGRSKGLILVQSHHDGHTLAQEGSERMTYSEAEIKDIARQLLKGLDYLHRKGLVHRDIKPDNIAVTETAVGRRVSLAKLGYGAVRTGSAQRRAGGYLWLHAA